MKKLWLWVAVLCLLLSCLSVGCGKQPAAGGTLTLENGVLHWEPTDAEAFTAYEVDLGGGGLTVTATSYDLAANCGYEGEFTVTVRGVAESGERTDIGSLTVNATRLAEPTVGIEGSADSGYYFVWSAVEGAQNYTYDAHDGNGLQTAEPADGGTYRVPVTSPIRQLIRVYANGTSKDDKLLLTSNTLYQYETSERFDLALLGQYPAVFTSSGAGAEEFRVGSTLPSGYYPNMELTVYLMSSGGTALTGNGTWGRRLSYSENVWLCANDVDGFPNSAIELPKADQKFTIHAGLMVDRGGNIILPLYDFLDGEMMVIVDIKYQGRSVLNASGGTPNPVPEVEKFDVSTAADYLYVFRSPGLWFNENRASNALQIPVNLPDGKQTVTVSYYVCQANGDILEGNGMWGRRLSSEYVDNGGPWVWLNAVELAANIPAVDIPNPTALQKFTFEAEIKNGILKMYAIDFNAGEMIIIRSVEGVKTPSGNGIYIFSGQTTEETLSVQTTLTGSRLSNVELTVTFKLSDIAGGSLAGNGAWGRRLHDATGTDIWLCATAPSADFPKAADTLPKAGEAVTLTIKVAEINKKGVFKLSGLDFLAGEMIQITSVKYNGEEILAKD